MTALPLSHVGTPEQTIGTDTEALDILYRDEHLIAINKPPGLLVHRSEIDRHETRFALQMLRDQIGQRVYPIHRIDKPTSGVLLFATNPDAARLTSELFAAGNVHKTYLAIVRGWCDPEGIIDHALTEERDKYTDRKARTEKPPQPAQTHYCRLATIELPVCIEKYPQSRYSLVACKPLTGRKHQIRRHMKHISHPIIGDAKHGRSRHNRYFSDHLDAKRLMLHAADIFLTHPVEKTALHIIAPLDTTWQQLLKRFDWQQSVSTLGKIFRIAEV